MYQDKRGGGGGEFCSASTYAYFISKAKILNLSKLKAFANKLNVANLAGREYC